ncbi:spore germination protein [Lysinibacillus antri]|uniref:Spore germination protein n=2 Tax=Lysinibacillus antri TaxID=2498145 RepID=A0A432L845_9BACI|nr:spore germination protein [Lysinibacillus antri]
MDEIEKPIDVQEWTKGITHYTNNSPDLIIKHVERDKKGAVFLYLDNMINHQEFSMLLLNLDQMKVLKYEELEPLILTKKISYSSELLQTVDAINTGAVCLLMENETKCMLISLSKLVERPLSASENESMIFGPSITFSESISTNIALLRKNITDRNLCTEKFLVGERNSTEVRIVYIKDIANEDNIATMKQRIQDLKIDDPIDSNVLAQLLDDNSLSLFPQALTTELPDRVCYMLGKGKIAIFVDRSPSVIIAPSSFLNFFETTDDVYTRWNIGSFLRIVRFIAMMLSLLLTPAYVAALTYHYEIIPSPLLLSLGQSRASVPFPPVLEALILEFILELLRESGARLPTKVGQTMGIVGGIVIGQAAVDAGFTSNILIIIIALSALGTFTAPSYMMGAVIRIVRFPLIILAGLWGGIGLIFGLLYIIIHLLKLTSFGTPYLVPIYPFRFSDWKDSLFRVPPQYAGKRPETNRPIDIIRYSRTNAKQRKDIDE